MDAGQLIENTKLSPQQAYIVALIAEGKSNGEIADQLGVAKGQIEKIRYTDLPRKFDRLLGDIDKIDKTLGILVDVLDIHEPEVETNSDSAEA